MIHGILNVYKEKGYTSHDVVAKLRGITGQKKIGHTGTLDPDAAGVLPVCLGRGTKLCDMLTDKDKCYEAVLLFGICTDTQDISGKVLERNDASGLEVPAVQEIIGSFVGGYGQVPPMYSALKVNGKKLYELAREGKTVERESRRVEIYDIEILEFSLPRVRMRITCSKGTYIRTLCHDIGVKTGCKACMESLVRVQSGPFCIADSLTLSEIEEQKKSGTLEKAVLPIDEMFGEYRAVTVGKQWERLAYNGNRLPGDAVMTEVSFKNGEKVRVYDERKDFIGIYQFEEGKRELALVKMFYPGKKD